MAINFETAIDRYTAKTAIAKHDEIVNNSKFKQTFSEIMNKAGLTDEAIAQRIRQLSEAKETKFFSDKGIVTETREVEALSIQADMIKFAAKAKGLVSERSTGDTINNTFIDLSSYDVFLDSSGQEAIDCKPSTNDIE